MANTQGDRVSLARLKVEVAQARSLEREIQRLKDQQKPLLSAIKAVMGDAREAFIGRDTVATQEFGTREQVDVKALREENPDVARKHLKTVAVRSFKLAKLPEDPA